MIPGANLLNMAFSLIASQQITYLAYQSRSTNAIGMQVPVYAAPVIINGSIQPMGRVLMETLGLDMQRHYVTIYAPNSMVDIRRDVTSDRFQFKGATFQGLSLTKWFSVDGWNAIIAVEVPNA